MGSLFLVHIRTLSDYISLSFHLLKLRGDSTIFRIWLDANYGDMAALIGELVGIKADSKDVVGPLWVLHKRQPSSGDLRR